MDVRELILIIFNISVIILIVSILLSILMLCVTYSYTAQDFLRTNAKIVLLKGVSYLSLLFVAILHFFF